MTNDEMTEFRAQEYPVYEDANGELFCACCGTGKLTVLFDNKNSRCNDPYCLCSADFQRPLTPVSKEVAESFWWDKVQEEQKAMYEAQHDL